MRHRAVSIALLLCAVLPVATCGGQPSGGPGWRRSSELGDRLQRWFEAIEQADRSNTRVLQVAFPGISVDPLTDLDDESRYRAFVAMLDSVPEPSAGYIASATRVDSVYKNILDFGRPIASPRSAEEAARLRAAERVLFGCRCRPWRAIVSFFTGSGPHRVSRKYRSYFRHARMYAEAQDRYTGASNDTSVGAKALASLKRKVDRLLVQWETRGHRQEVERALAEYETLTANEPDLVWARIRDSFEEQQRHFASGRSVPATEVSPPLVDWPSDEGWTLLGAPDDGSADSRVLVKRVRIMRPWLDERLLGDLAWTWMAQSPLGADYVVSDGRGLGKRFAAAGALPLLPVEILLARPAGGAADKSDIRIVGFVSEIVQQQPRRLALATTSCAP